MLVYARREESALHERALAELTALAESRGPWALPLPCVVELVRVLTHARVLRPPSTLDGAFAFIDALLESPSVQLLCPGPKFLEHFRAAARGADARGNLAFDAQIAAVCLEHGVREILTADRDFARFSDLKPVWLA